METLDGYSELVRDHVQNPRNGGRLDPADGEGEAENPACGDVVRFTLRLGPGVIREARFQARGCPATLAAASWLAAWLEGAPVSELVGLDPAAIDQGLGGLPPARFHGAELAVRAARQALRAGEQGA